MADKTIIQAIVQAWKIGFPIFFPKLGIVDSVDSEKKTSNRKGCGRFHS